MLVPCPRNKLVVRTLSVRCAETLNYSGFGTLAFSDIDLDTEDAKITTVSSADRKHRYNRVRSMKEPHQDLWEDSVWHENGSVYQYLSSSLSQILISKKTRWWRRRRGSREEGEREEGEKYLCKFLFQ